MINFVKALIVSIEDAGTNCRRQFILRVTFVLLRYAQQKPCHSLCTSGTHINSLVVCVLKWKVNLLHQDSKHFNFKIYAQRIYLLFMQFGIALYFITKR